MKKVKKSSLGKQLRQLNYLIPGVVTHQVLQFECAGSEIKASRVQDCPAHKKPKENWSQKDYRNLVREKINVSWIGGEQVFIKVIHLPGESPEELRMMVELQLEKISPIPLAQLVWDIQVLPNPQPLPLPETDPEHPEEEIKQMYRYAIVVLMAERGAVEEFLTLLEESAFYADRIEFPFIHEILVQPQSGPRDGLYVYPMHCGAKILVINAWWTSGELQNIDMIYLPDDPSWKQVLQTQLNQVYYAGQLEGWLQGDFRWTLDMPYVEDPMLPEADWHEFMVSLYGETGTMEKRISASELAKLSCSLICSGVTANLLPTDLAQSYRQKYIDRLWLQGITAVILAYFLFCIVYFIGSAFADYQKARAENKVNALAGDFRTAQKLRAQVDLLQTQHSLKFAALDCYRLTAELMPEELKLTRLNFNGETLSYVGEAPADQIALVTSFNEALGRAMTYDENPVLFFTTVNPPTSAQKPGGGNILTWRFSCDLNMPEQRGIVK